MFIFLSHVYSPVFAEKMNETQNNLIMSKGKILNINDTIKGITFYHIIYDKQFFLCLVINNMPDDSRWPWADLKCYNQNKN